MSGKVVTPLRFFVIYCQGDRELNRLQVAEDDKNAADAFWARNVSDYLKPNPSHWAVMLTKRGEKTLEMRIRHGRDVTMLLAVTYLQAILERQGRPADTPLFQPGQIVMTVGAREALRVDLDPAKGQQLAATLVRAHVCGKWRNLPKEDREMNERNAQSQGPIWSKFKIKVAPDTEREFLIGTGFGHQSTTIALPEEN